MAHDPRRPHRQDTFDLRDQIMTDASNAYQHHPQGGGHQQHGGQYEDEDHSILEDDSENEDGDEQDEFMDEDDSSSLSIPNESIDFDLVYSLHTFVATVEGQANVVKGDSLFLMDDSNSYWWLVRVLKTQEVGYIPAENIETPFERLARLNKHRNVDLAAASPEERTHDPVAVRAQIAVIAQRQGPSHPAHPSNRRSVFFQGSRMFHYPPAVWNEEEQEGWEEDNYESYDTGLEHPLNDEEEWDEDNDDDQWDDLGNNENGPSFAHQQETPPQGTPPLALQQQRSQPQQGQQMRGQQNPQYMQDPQQQQQQQRGMQQGQQGGGQYGAQDPRMKQQQQQQGEHTVQHQGSTNSLRQETSNSSLRQQGSREPLSPEARSNPSSGSVSPGAAGGSPNGTPGGSKVFDPEALDSNETRKISVTPSVARDQQYSRGNQAPASSGTSGPLLPSAILAAQDDERKRIREELEEDARKRKLRDNQERSPSQQSNRTDGGKGSGKLTKAPGGKEAQSNKEKEKNEREREKEDESGRKRGVFGGLFKRKDKSEKTSTTARREEEYARGGSISTSDEGANGSIRSGQSNERPGQSQEQGHGLRVQQQDMKQQAAYQQWMKSTANEPGPQPSYGLQSASAYLPNNSSSGNLRPGAMKPGTNTSPSGVTQFGERTLATSPKSGSDMLMGSPGSSSGHQRPGSLILTAAGLGFQGGANVPELSVMRVFAGANLSTEATFKTVLLNSSTTAGDLVKQAMQRFRVAAGEDAADYYLTVKTQFEGSFTTLQNNEKPLQVFEEMVDANARDEILPTIKRSSIASISSLSSNLSMHPAIRRLPMNDFTDDSAVKFYLNRFDTDKDHSAHHGRLHEENRLANARIESHMSMGSTTDEDPFSDGVSIAASTSSNNVAHERLTAPTARFAMQVLIYPDDLPEGMVFDPHTEAIVPKATLKDRTPLSSTASPGISQTFRRKVFVFPKNTTVAEVIEVSLERFGISEGVVDGGDEVEDKNVKRRSANRVRYGLSCLSDGQEKELLPSSKVVDAFGRPPSFRMADQRRSLDGKRRSADATMLLGTAEDVRAGDPEFILRRAVAYKMNNTPRSRLSAPLDELALSRMHAQRESITASEASTRDDDTNSNGATPRPGANPPTAVRLPPAQLSRQEIIAAQRERTRASQKAILSAQANSEQGVDIHLPDKARIRSSFIGSDEMYRYSYVDPEGATYDISEIVEEELRGHPSPSHRDGSSSGHGGRKDLLQGALGRDGVGEIGQHAIGEKIDRVLHKIKDNPKVSTPDGRRISAVYTDNQVVTPPSRPERAAERAPSRSNTPSGGPGAKIVASRAVGQEHKAKQASVQSLESEASAYESTASTPNKPDTAFATSQKPRGSPNRSVLDEGTEEDVYLPPESNRKRPLLVLKDHDLGLSRMLAVIEMNASMRPPAPWQKQDRTPSRHRLRRQQSMLSSDNVVDEVLFGPTVDMEELHPRVREIYEPMAKRLDALDKEIDNLLLGALKLSQRG
ncbi:hypothetical protein PIIN_06882 [Serendipita indica DSM 11827]|uniref:SH3 domain-containing protein n=1 Tax=Serendipita indica (strain DSM 11827) TaxID=1109443 RepID=G4U371_SERID|nr:hypothetical protein PIIN_06882 [Serendipita indica DSM 11827]